jgi:hypothetical protein
MRVAEQDGTGLRLSTDGTATSVLEQVPMWNGLYQSSHSRNEKKKIVTVCKDIAYKES